jgi:hypothetical protein
MPVVARLRAALEPQYVNLGGRNVRLLQKLPSGCQRRDNKNALAGGFRQWGDNAVEV